MRRALEYARTFGLPVIDHCEDLDLSKGGAMNEGAVSVALGIPSAPHVSETIMVERDVLLAEYTGSHVHIAHISTAHSTVTTPTPSIMPPAAMPAPAIAPTAMPVSAALPPTAAAIIAVVTLLHGALVTRGAPRPAAGSAGSG